MFSTPTVLVIGAGAGFDVGMPVGEQLSSEIADKLNIRFDEWGNQLKSGDPVVTKALRRIAKVANEDFDEWRRAACSVSSGIGYTRSIDAYIHTHKSNQKIKDCAKLAIAQTILEYEGRSALALDSRQLEFRDRRAVLNSWLPDLMYVLQDRISVDVNLAALFENLTIINFNYDRCIEHFLLAATRELFHLDMNQAAELLASLKIFHPYGQVGVLPWQVGRTRQVNFGTSDYGDIEGLSREIKTFNEKVDEGDELREIRTAVGEAHRIVFLGFHFHQQNMDLLRALPVNLGSAVHVIGTALNRDEPEMHIIDKQIREMLSNRAGQGEIKISPRLDCKKFFKEWGTTLVR